MKTFSKLIFIFFISWYSNTMSSQVIPEELLGVWKYEIAGVEAIGIYSPTHAAWVGVKNNRTNLNGITVTAEQKAKAYEEMFDIGILTLTLERPGRCKAIFIHSHNPQNVGKSFSWDFEVKDGYNTYWIIQPDGSRDIQRKARKLAGWHDKKELSNMNGLWEYSNGINGHFLLCGNYAIWYVLNNINANTNADEWKAHAFDAFNSSAGIGQKLSGNGFGLGLWHNLISSDMRAEKQIEFYNSHKINKDLYDIWFVDGAGNQVGQKWQIQRISK